MLLQLVEVCEFASTEDANRLTGRGGLRRRRRLLLRLGRIDVVVSHFLSALGPLGHVRGVLLVSLGQRPGGILSGGRGGGDLHVDILLVQPRLLHDGDVGQGLRTGVPWGQGRFEADRNLRFRLRRPLLRLGGDRISGGGHVGRGFLRRGRRIRRGDPRRRARVPDRLEHVRLLVSVVAKILPPEVAVVQLRLRIVEEVARRLVEHPGSGVEYEGRAGGLEVGRPLLLPRHAAAAAAAAVDPPRLFAGVVVVVVIVLTAPAGSAMMVGGGGAVMAIVVVPPPFVARVAAAVMEVGIGVGVVVGVSPPRSVNGPRHRWS